MYEDKYIDFDINSDEYKRRLALKRKKRAEIRKKQKRKQRIIIIASFAIVLLIILLSVLIPSNSKLKVIKGTWVYNDMTTYEFNGKGNGCLIYGEQHYEYEYSIKDNILNLDFENAAVHDCQYEFEIIENELTLIGKEGTVGGTYKLNKK